MTKKLSIDHTLDVTAGPVRIKATAEPLEIETDPAELVAAPAQAMARALERGIRSVDAQAADSTIRQRRAKGIASTRRWNATGELARSVRAERDGKDYVVTVSDDRLQDPELLERLADDVPELDELPREVDAALERALDESLGVRRR
jgi:hypothetical protein